MGVFSELPTAAFGSWRTPPPFNADAVLVWDKGDAVGMGDLQVPWKPNHEPVWIRHPRSFAGRRTSGVLRHYSCPMPHNGHHRRYHPHDKPTALMVELVSKAPGVVLDPFAGSGSTLVAAKTLGRRAIGVEIERQWCDVAVERLRQGVLPFGPNQQPVVHPTTDGGNER